MTLSLNTIVLLAGQILIVYGAYTAFKGRTDALLESQENLLSALSERFKLHEQDDDKRFEELRTRLLELVASVSRLVGQAEYRRRT